MGKKYLITVGGTGGHVFPALALAHQLKEKDPTNEIIFMGGSLNANRFFDKESFPYETVSCGTISIKKPFKSLMGCAKILKGIWQSRSLLKKHKPHLIVGFGSYYTLPTLMAAKLCGIPFVLHESNSIPGKVNRLMSPFALTTGIQFPQTKQLLKGNTHVVETPLRKGFSKGKFSREEARNYFGLDPNKTTLLVFGGSQGAKALNYFFIQAFSTKLKQCPVQLIHITGSKELTQEVKNCYERHQIKACVKDFEFRMDMAWTAADIVISRSGAGTIAEQLEFEVPGILIPYPQATDNHQEVNADFMVGLGGAIKYREKDFSGDVLSYEIESLLALNHKRLGKMTQAIEAYKKEIKIPEFTHVIATLIGQS